MADAMTLAKLPTEKMSAFNARLRAACDQQPVTGAQILVPDGEPVVVLFSEMVEATKEDVDEGAAEKAGELIPEKDPVVVQVARMQCDTDKAATRTQEHMEVLFTRADGAVVEILNASGKRAGWLEGPDKRQHYVQVPVHYVLVSYLPDDDEGEGDDQDDGEAGDDADVEARLRRPVAEKV